MKKNIIIIAAIAAAYVIYKTVKWNSAMATLGGINVGSHDANMLDDYKQYAPQWSSHYDWMQGVERNGTITYA